MTRAFFVIYACQQHPNTVFPTKCRKGHRHVAKPYRTMVHIGKLIEAELRKQERSVSWFARKLFCGRNNVYDIFQRQDIDTHLLTRISLILHHDFFTYYKDEMELLLSDKKDSDKENPKK